MRIKMLMDVIPCFMFMTKPGTILKKGIEYDAKANKHGAISGICENGEALGVKPGEFVFVSAPDWIAEIWGKVWPPSLELDVM